MKSKILTFLILTIVITAAGLLFRRYGLFKVLLTYEIHIRTFLMSKPILGFVIGLFSYFLLSIIPGTGGKSLIYGWLFGFWQAVIIADCALTAAAVVTFLLSRTLMRDAIRSRFFFLMQKLDHSFEREGAYYLLALRLMHSPYTLTNYVCGATSLSTFSFWWSTQLGLIPSTMVFVFAGTQIPTLEEVIQYGASAVLSPKLLLALVLMGLFPLLIRWVSSQYWKTYPEKIQLKDK